MCTLKLNWHVFVRL